MAYRETSRTRAHKNNIRTKILTAATNLAEEHGFTGTSVSAIAKEAGVATGSVYRYFANKQELCLEIFRHATEQEITQVREALHEPGNIIDRLQAAITVFAERALHNKKLTYTLIAEPLDPVLDKERHHYREQYAQLFAEIINEGVLDQTLCPQNPHISGAAIVGAMAESVITNLLTKDTEIQVSHSKLPPPLTSQKQYISELVGFCLRSIGVTPQLCP